MQILWLVKTTLPQAAAAWAGRCQRCERQLADGSCRAAGAPGAASDRACVGKAEAAGRADGVDYRIVTGTAVLPLLQRSSCDPILSTSGAPNMMRPPPWPRLPRPPVCLCCSAYRASCGTAPRICATASLPPIAAPARCGIPLDRIVPGELLDTMQASFLTHWPPRRPHFWHRPAM